MSWLQWYRLCVEGLAGEPEISYRSQVQGIVSLARLQLPGLLPRAAEIFTDRKMSDMKIHRLVLPLLLVFAGTIVPARAEKPEPQIMGHSTYCGAHNVLFSGSRFMLLCESASIRSAEFINDLRNDC